MVKVIMGVKGTGKTKQLIASINNAIENESGSMVCVEKGNKLTFDIDYRVRLIDSSEYQMGSYTFLKGFISGLHAGNFDITHIFIDSLYKISGSDSISETEDFLTWCDAFAAQNGIKFTITISADIATATEKIKQFF